MEDGWIAYIRCELKEMGLDGFSLNQDYFYEIKPHFFHTSYGWLY